jgi:magnesium chelatase family protein
MAVKLKSFVLIGEKVKPINIEVEILRGMPDFKVIGLSDRSIREVHDRARAAIKNNGYKFPIHRKIINLVPAHLPKKGTHFDLPIILGLLIKSGQVIYSPKPDTLFIGEVTLNGDIKPVPNITRILESAKENMVSRAFIPNENLEEVMIEGIDLIPVKTLKDLINNLHTPNIQSIPKKCQEAVFPTFDDIINQTYAKRAITIALSGRHSLLLIGPPGSGKSILAQSAQNLIPGSPFETINGDITLAKLKTEKYEQSKYGLLVLNEFHELNKQTMDYQKTILESSPNHTIIATINPCRCGYSNDPHKVCYCTPYNLKLFRQKISGPILDRFDMAIRVIADPVVSKPEHDLQETRAAALSVAKTRKIQQIQNNEIPLKSLIKQLEPKAKNLAQVIESKYQISNRRLQKLLQVAKTIADESMSPKVSEENLAQSFKLQKFLICNEWTNKH